jgi:DNA-binding NtrC family response regulator
MVRKQQDQKAPAEARKESKQPDVLVIEDDAQILSLLSRIITRWNYNVETAQGGLEGLTKFRERLFDVVLTASWMKDIDGMKVTTRIKAEYPDAEIVMMTEYGAIEEAVEAIKRGAADFIQKPLDFDHLKLILDRCAARLRLLWENRRLKQVASAAPGLSLFLDEEQLSLVTLRDFRLKVVDPLEKKYIEGMLRANRGDISETARKMDISLTTLSDKMKEHGLNIEDFKSQ